jgi:hypothetical protein
LARFSLNPCCRRSLLCADPRNKEPGDWRGRIFLAGDASWSKVLCFPLCPCFQRERIEKNSIVRYYCPGSSYAALCVKATKSYPSPVHDIHVFCALHKIQTDLRVSCTQERAIGPIFLESLLSPLVIMCRSQESSLSLRVTAVFRRYLCWAL